MRLGARLWWGVIPLLLLLWAVGALTSVAFPGLPQTPLATLALLPVVGFAKQIAIAITIGTLVTLLMGPAAATPRLRRWAHAWGAVALALVIASAAALIADIRAAVPGIDLQAITDSLAGRALAVQFIGLAVGIVLAGRGPRALRWAALIVALLGAVAPALSGHAGLSGPHTAAGFSIALHVMAVSLWIGGLAVVVGLLAREPEAAPVLLPRFSALALGCVIVLAESGLLTASLTAGTLGDLFGSDYGSLVVMKAALLLVLIRLGWLQRRRVVDAVRAHGPAAPLPLLGRLAGGELAIMGVALAGSVVLARIGPPPAPASGFTPLTLVMLGLVAPMALAAMRPLRWRPLAGVPEVPVIVLCILIAEIGGVGLAPRLLGGLGLLLDAIVLILVGWLAAGAMRASRSAVVIAAIGLPVALGVAWWLSGTMAWQLVAVALLAGEAGIIIWSRHDAMARTAEVVPA